MGMASVDHQVAIISIMPRAAQAFGPIVSGAGTSRVTSRKAAPRNKPMTWVLGNPCFGSDPAGFCVIFTTQCLTEFSCRRNLHKRWYKATPEAGADRSAHRIFRIRPLLRCRSAPVHGQSVPIQRGFPLPVNRPLRRSGFAWPALQNPCRAPRPHGAGAPYNGPAVLRVRLSGFPAQIYDCSWLSPLWGYTFQGKEYAGTAFDACQNGVTHLRSEERRVGKECR